ncbi:hypothetical protein HCEG_01769 [Histoplasma capsulatum var. duboisii H88]|uniref:Uncharacterized protein n=1 Tax=Ajellomyces capsulatus (strain H88) TaxID=544711 RepID=F0U7E0_AJEC8|nr:hypothetical protein HCEG_01769 [Histoplasma capsulatum var. duboisii H88]
MPNPRMRNQNAYTVLHPAVPWQPEIVYRKTPTRSLSHVSPRRLALPMTVTVGWIVRRLQADAPTTKSLEIPDFIATSVRGGKPAHPSQKWAAPSRHPSTLLLYGSGTSAGRPRYWDVCARA